jgi:hypothetical protein
MIPCTAAVTLAGLLVLGPAPAKQELYTVKIKPIQAGDTVRIDKDETQVARTRLLDASGRTVADHTERGGETFVFRETIVEAGPGPRAARLRRQYEKAQTKKGRRSVDLPFHGRAVRIELRDGRYRFFLEGGRELMGDDVAPLDREFNGGDEKFRLDNLLPGKPVPVGGVWRIDMAPLVKDFTRTGRFAVDENGAKGTGRLAKASPLGGSQFGDLIYRLEIPVQAMSVNPGEARRAALPGSRGVFDFTLKLCIDGTLFSGNFLSSGEVTVTADVPGGGPGKMHYTITVDSRESRELVGPGKPAEKKQTGAAPLSQPGGPGADVPKTSRKE